MRRRGLESVQLLLSKELKTEQTTITRVSKKKLKHKASKPRRLKFDVHDRFLN